MRLSVIGEADTKPQLMIIYPLPSRPTIIKLLYSPRFGIFFLFEKENACKRKANEPFPLDTRNAAPQYIARGSQPVARHIRPQTRRSLNECGLVRLASQAVQPSQNIVAYRPWSGRYAPCFSPTSPRFIRHRRRFGDVAHSFKLRRVCVRMCRAAD